MHPLNNFKFGRATGRIAVRFHNGSAVVTGYVRKQLGTRRFVVALGALTRTCTLAQTAGNITTLTTDTNLTTNTFCTIEVAIFGGGTENVRRLNSKRVLTVQGSSVTYNLGVSATIAGQGTVATYTNTNAITFANPATATVTTRTLTAIPFTAGSGSQSDPLTYRINTKPGSGHLRVNGNVVYDVPYSLTAADLANVTYFPDRVGTFTVAAVATDGLTSATSTRTITVNGLVLATPTALGISTLTQTALNFAVATDTSGLPVTYSLTGTIPAFGTVRIGAVVVATFPQVLTAAELTTLSYTAAATRNGSFPITVTASNGVESVSAIQAITVSSV